MDLALTEEQELLRSTVRELLEAHSPPDQVRALEDDPIGYSRDLWDQLAQLDLIGLGLPAEHGGSGMGALETAIVFEELGRALAPTPLLTTAVIGAALIAAGGTPEQRAEWLPRIARGDAVLTVAWYEPERSDGPDGVQLRAGRDGDQHRLTGTKIRVPFASAADALLTLARSDDGIDVFVVDGASDGIERTQTHVLGSDAEYEVRFADVAVPASARLGQPGAGWELFREAMTDGLIAVAAYAVGGAQRAHELAVGYASEREQFGRKIGSFQGLAHPLADLATEIAGTRTLVHQAAWARGLQRDAGPLAAMAKYAAADVFKRTTKHAQQVFGGIGFTTVIDIQLYFRRAKQLELTWFGPRFLEEEIAAAELDGERGSAPVGAGV